MERGLSHVSGALGKLGLGFPRNQKKFEEVDFRVEHLEVRTDQFTFGAHPDPNDLLLVVSARGHIQNGDCKAVFRHTLPYQRTPQGPLFRKTETDFFSITSTGAWAVKIQVGDVLRLKARVEDQGHFFKLSHVSLLGVIDRPACPSTDRF
jgi:hypothetical protein